MTWTENRTQRMVATQRTGQVSNQFTLSTYVSTAGRLFTRWSVSGTHGAGSADQVGESGQNKSGGAHVAQFEGKSLVIVSAYNGGARHLQADFDASFASCTANVILGKSANNGSIRFKSLINGKDIEVLSSTVSSAACSIKDGNVFATQ